MALAVGETVKSGLSLTLSGLSDRYGCKLSDTGGLGGIIRRTLGSISRDPSMVRQTGRLKSAMTRQEVEMFRVILEARNIELQYSGEVDASEE